MELTMTNSFGFCELNEQEMMAVDGGVNWGNVVCGIGIAIAGTALVCIAVANLPATLAAAGATCAAAVGGAGSASAVGAAIGSVVVKTVAVTGGIVTYSNGISTIYNNM